DVTVGDHQHVVLGFVHETYEPCNLVVDGIPAGTKEQSDAALREITYQLLQYGQRGIVLVDAENDLVSVRIVLAAEAGVVFVRIRIEAPDRLQTTHRRREVGQLAPLTPCGT